MAAFIEIELTTELLEKVIEYSSFQYMRGKYDLERRAFELQTIKSTNDDQLAAEMQKHFDGEVNLKYIRQGAVNGWKSYMTPEQSQRIEDRFNEICQKCDGLESYFAKWDTLQK